MPAGDRTGPLGEGSMTGRGEGFCGGATEDDFVKAAGRGGFGMGRGGRRMRGRGGGRGFGQGRGRGRGDYRRVDDPDDASGQTGSLLGRLLDRLEAVEKRLATREMKD